MGFREGTVDGADEGVSVGFAVGPEEGEDEGAENGACENDGAIDGTDDGALVNLKGSDSMIVSSASRIGSEIEGMPAIIGWPERTSVHCREASITWMKEHSSRDGTRYFDTALTCRNWQRPRAA